MLGRRTRGQHEFLFAGSLRDLIPDDHVLVRVDRVLDLSWLRAEVAECSAAGSGHPGIDPEAAVRLMLAGLLLGIVHDRRLMREAVVNLAIRWFAGYGLTEALPDHSSLTRIRQRWGAERFRRIFTRSVEACMVAGIAKGEVVHTDSSLVRADVSWEAIARKHAEAVEAHGLKHKRTRPYTPRTNGKAERFIQTSIREWAYASPFSSSADRTRAMHPWLHAYNTAKPHSALKGLPPVSRVGRDNVLGNDT